MFTKVNILVPFFEEPYKKFHLRELAKILKLSPAGVRKIVEHIVRDKLILESRERNLRLFQANFDNRIFKEYKKFFTIVKIYESGFVDFLNHEFLYPAIILFGSAAKGEDTKNSDIDLLILSNEKKTLKLDNFEKKLNRRLQLFVMTQNEFALLKKTNPELFNNIVNGIRLEGFLKVV